MSLFKGCMVDGFGWFKPADYRRAWLMFDELEYALPGELRGPLRYPRQVVESDEYRAQWVKLGEHRDLVGRLVQLGWRDDKMRTLCSGVPSGDVGYARLVVLNDGDMAELIEDLPIDDPVPPVVALASKLVVRAAVTGALPIVGKEYAWEIVARLISLMQTPAASSTAELSDGLLDERQSAMFARLSAGMSLRFVPDEAILELPFDKLQAFKTEHADLLRQHNLHLAEVAQAFEGLPAGATFQRELRTLRLAAEKRRAEIDKAAKDAWRGFGLKLGKMAVQGALAGLPPLLLMSQQRPLHEIVISLLPAAAVLANAVIDQAAQLRHRHCGTMAYLFEAERGLLADG